MQNVQLSCNVRWKKGKRNGWIYASYRLYHIDLKPNNKTAQYRNKKAFRSTENSFEKPILF